MRHCSVTGGGGIQLHVVETGNQTGRPIVFIHGLSQCWLEPAAEFRSSR
jgi:non-heme chloroperoxidase